MSDVDTDSEISMSDDDYTSSDVSDYSDDDDVSDDDSMTDHGDLTDILACIIDKYGDVLNKNEVNYIRNIMHRF